MADILTRPELGFVDFVTLHLGPILGVGNAFVFTLIVTVIALIITTFVQGTLVAAIMLPLILPSASAMGFSIMAVIMPFVFVANIGLVFPSSHPIGAIMHGHESIGPQMTLRYMTIYMAVSFVIAVVVGIPLGLLIF
jgi:sodium-dependent dicarboxylate transporter 2/3/5